jgi:two-component SAPR family response regulator
MTKDTIKLFVEKNNLSDKIISVIDDDKSTLQLLKKIYEQYGIKVNTYLYPDNLIPFLQESITSDYIFIDHLLGGANGAAIAAGLIYARIKGSVFIISSTTKSYSKFFITYIDKLWLTNNPLAPFQKEPSLIDYAVELGILMGDAEQELIKEISCFFEDNK